MSLVEKDLLDILSREKKRQFKAYETGTKRKTTHGPRKVAFEFPSQENLDFDNPIVGFYDNWNVVMSDGSNSSFKQPEQKDSIEAGQTEQVRKIKFVEENKA